MKYKRNRNEIQKKNEKKRKTKEKRKKEGIIQKSGYEANTIQ